MRRLIINADDLGMNAPRSHGIFLCMEQGIVTNATLICNGSDSARAAKQAREKHLPVGIHLNVTEGTPLSKHDDVQSLLHHHGAFLDRHHLRRAFDEGTVDPRHLEREIRAQIEWFLDHHGAPTHLDGHHHMHIHPMIVPVLIPILQRYGIRFVRIPSDLLPPFGFEIENEQLQKAMTIAAQADAARILFDAEGISSTDSFRGLALTGTASAKNLRHILGRLPEGTTELMVHPGSPTPIGTEFDRHPQRQTELMMLTDPAVRSMLAERKIELISYRDL